MRKVTIKLASGKKETVETPRTYFEMNAGMFEKICSEYNWTITPESITKLFSLITGGNYEDYLLSNDMSLESEILRVTGFVLNTKVLDELPMPGRISYKGKTIEIKTSDIAKRITVGQSLYIRRCLFNSKDVRSGICLATAVFLQPILDGKFDDVKAEEMANEFRSYPVTEIYPIGFFILRRLEKSGNGLIDFLRLIFRTTKNSIAAVRSLLNRVKLQFLYPTMKLQ